MFPLEGIEMELRHVPLAGMALTLLLVMAGCGRDNDREGDVMKAEPLTVRLTINGKPPPDEGFVLQFGDSPADVLGEAYFCGDPRLYYGLDDGTDDLVLPDSEPCEEGRTYTVTVNAYRGYTLVRVAGRGRQIETFVQESASPPGGVYSTEYTYP